MIGSKFTIGDHPLSKWLEEAAGDLQIVFFERCDPIHFSKGEAIFHADDEPGGIFGVISGRIDSHLPRLKAERTLVHASGPGAWIGDMAAFSGRPRRFDLLAGAKSEVLRISRSELFKLCEQRPEIWRYMTILVASSLRISVDALETLCFDDPTIRMATCLLRLDAGGPGWNGQIPASQKDLASMAGMSRRRAIMALEVLETAGYVQRGYGVVTIVDAQSLAALIDE